MIAEVIKPLIETDPSLKVKSVIAKVRSKFNYTTNYCKIWLAKQKAIANLYGGWEASYGALPSWFEAMVDGTHLYGKYKRALLVTISQDGNGNIVPFAFAVVKGETSDASHFFLTHLCTRGDSRWCWVYL
ncbi:uncharacterized protein [Arachis hypogaea]|uniref:uncharacterized protein n=1 Tax=Arachis hypogaea TaxID=3818 RepID=UPI000DED2547|nr:uncharacterized protein LOC112733781 [Arachis hypogaea]